MKKWIIAIAAVQAVTICHAGKNRPVKQQEKEEIVITESMKAVLRDSLKTVSSLAAADLQRGDSTSAMRNYEKAYALAVKVDDKTEIVPAGMYIGNQYLKIGQNKAAETAFEQVFNAADVGGRWDIKLEASDRLAELFTARSYFIRANYFQKESYALREKAGEVVKKQDRAKLQAEFDAMVKAKDKEWKQQQADAQEATVAKDRYINFLMIGACALAAFILVLFFRIYSLKKTVFEVEKENDLLIHNKKHITAELERVHRLNNELKGKQGESVTGNANVTANTAATSSPALKALTDKISDTEVPVVQLRSVSGSAKSSGQ